MGGTAISLRSARACSNRLRAQQWRGRAAIHRQIDGSGALVSIQPAGGRLLGLAVDTGTTKLAAYLVDLATGGNVEQGRCDESSDRLRRRRRDPHHIREHR